MMAQWDKELATKPDDLSSVFRTNIVGENKLLEDIL